MQPSYVCIELLKLTSSLLDEQLDSGLRFLHNTRRDGLGIRMPFRELELAVAHENRKHDGRFDHCEALTDTVALPTAESKRAQK